MKYFLNLTRFPIDLIISFRPNRRLISVEKYDHDHDYDEHARDNHDHDHNASLLSRLMLFIRVYEPYIILESWEAEQETSIDHSKRLR